MTLIQAIDKKMRWFSNILEKIKVPGKILEIAFEPWIRFYFNAELKRMEELNAYIKEMESKMIKTIIEKTIGLKFDVN